MKSMVKTEALQATQGVILKSIRLLYTDLPNKVPTFWCLHF